ncbi:MAG: DUF1858 domain-containing protein [Chloroflexi bacterium]|nr:MAG: DUF1858 domain-containing protein [Chloroflexota bacterium]MBL1194988.1 DUF1858 domain-containing protein [Chloroflexota bacterium]NOH12276.1 DUF1858 domain-containing protein [Chloroflexota bacterium]
MTKAVKTKITKDTRVADILMRYGDIADVMELFGVKRVGRYSLRMLVARALTVEWAARVHRVPLDEFIAILNEAIEKQINENEIDSLFDQENKRLENTK